MIFSKLSVMIKLFPIFLECTGYKSLKSKVSKKEKKKGRDSLSPPPRLKQ